MVSKDGGAAYTDQVDTLPDFFLCLHLAVECNFCLLLTCVTCLVSACLPCFFCNSTVFPGYLGVCDSRLMPSVKSRFSSCFMKIRWMQMFLLTVLCFIVLSATNKKIAYERSQPCRTPLCFWNCQLLIVHDFVTC